MWKILFVAILCALVTGGVFGAAVSADDKLVRFKGGIGSQPLRAGALVNDVFGVNPGGRPWVIDDLDAKVSANGDIEVKGRGLILAGGNNIGTSGAGQTVRARLFCGGAAHDSPLVPLALNGDFEIDAVLSPLPPNPCLNPVLLIVSAGGNWFAAGIPDLD